MISKALSLESFYRKLDLIFPLYFGVYFIEFFFGLWQLTTVIKLFSIILSLIFALKIINSTDRGSGTRDIFTLFYAYNIISGVFYCVNDVPIRCYLNELYNSIPAMFFFYVGLGENRCGNRFYEKIMLSTSVCMLIGIVLYVTTPGWFVERRIEIADMTSWSGTKYDESSLLSHMRFSSYLLEGYEAQTFAMFALATALFTFFKKSYHGEKWFGISLILINYVAAVLTQQRVAMVAATFSVLFYYLYGKIRGRSKQSKNLILTFASIAVLAIIVIPIYFGDRAEQLLSLLTDRMDNMSITGALQERNYQKSIFDSWTMPITGKGLGSGGAIAGSYGLPHVNDAGYYQMLYEIGIIGSMLFVFLIGRTLIRAIKHMKVYLIELVIIMFFLVALLGSNILNFGYMIVMPFWYTIGRVWNTKNYKEALQNKDYI